MNPSITVVVPLYNGIRYVNAAIDSVRSQTVSDWRMLVIDDVSSDGSCAFVQELSSGDPRIQVVRNPKNLGLYGTLNTWIHRVETPWTVILMQDDMLFPDHFETFLRLSEKHPESALYWSGQDDVNESGLILKSGPVSEEYEVIKPSVDAWYNVMRRGCIWTISGSFSRTAYLRKTGFRSDLPHAADFNLIVASVRSVPTLYSSRALTKIRIHDGQTTNTHAKRAQDIREYMKIICEQIKLYPDDLSLFKRIRLKAGRRWGAVRRIVSCLKNWNLSGVFEAAKLSVFFR